MTQVDRIAILLPLATGAIAVVATILIHALALRATVNFVRYEKRLEHAGAGFSIDIAIVSMTMSFALVAHLIEIAVWAVLFVVCGEFPAIATACYHSAVNYTTLGYGDLIMTSSWGLLGPLEAADGMVMFRVSAAIVFAVIQRLIQARFADLQGPPIFSKQMLVWEKK
jgi:Ion channel